MLAYSAKIACILCLMGWHTPWSFKRISRKKNSPHINPSTIRWIFPCSTFLSQGLFCLLMHESSDIDTSHIEIRSCITSMYLYYMFKGPILITNSNKHSTGRDPSPMISRNLRMDKGTISEKRLALYVLTHVQWLDLGHFLPLNEGVDPTYRIGSSWSICIFLQEDYTWHACPESSAKHNIIY